MIEPLQILPLPRGTCGWDWACEAVSAHHYLHTVPDPRTRPSCHIVYLGSYRVGCLFFGRPESTCLYQGGLTYGSLADVARGRAEYDRWEVLNLSRFWLDPSVQAGGRLHSPDCLPGYLDRRGRFRATLASVVIRQTLHRVGYDYLEAHPPCFIGEPYRIRAVLSYCDTRLHRGTIYQAAGFQLARTNAAGIQTWWTPEVAGLTPEEDQQIRRLAETCPRSIGVRARKSTRLY